MIHQGNVYRIIRYPEPGHVRHELDGQQIGEYTSRETANQIFERITQESHAVDADSGELSGKK